MLRRWTSPRAIAALVVVLGVAGYSVLPVAAEWRPTKPVEFNVPAGMGGGADIMARFLAPLFQTHNLSTSPFVVVNRSGGAGAEAFLHMKANAGDPHKVVITLSNLFTTPLMTGVPFNWRDLTPVARLALDYFVLWVNAKSPYQTAKEYFDAVKAKPGVFRMGGTGSKQEDQIITVQLEQALGLDFTYIPFKGGGEVAVELVGQHVDSTVNNPAEAVSHWQAGNLRPLAVIDHERIPLPEWNKIPTLKEVTGVDLSYLMLRGIFAPPGISKEAQAGYVELFRRVTHTPDFKHYLSDFALKPAFLSGDEYVKWLAETEELHKDLMRKGGMIK